MTVRSDLDRAIAMAEAAKGNYLLFASDSQDEMAQEVFTDMAEDMERHAMILRSRIEYLDEHNQLNQLIAQDAADEPDADQKNGKEKQGKEKQGKQKQGH